ncbi:hypothetical protein LN971_004861 [Salmonella enterica]|nr:hypothetical protein [Salmonella enterica]
MSLFFLSMPVSEGKLSPGNNSFFHHKEKQGMKKNRNVFNRVFVAGQVLPFFRGGELNCQYSLFLRVLRARRVYAAVHDGAVTLDGTPHIYRVVKKGLVTSGTVNGQINLTLISL